MKKVAVIAPTYNEEDNINSFLTAVINEQENLPGCQLEIVVSDSHSRDKTAAIVRRRALENKHIHYLDVEKRGLGLGLSEGLDWAVKNLKADYLVTMEADLSNNPNQLPEFIAKLSKADLVVGSRYGQGGKIVNWSWWRKLLSRMANLILMLLAGSLQVHEYTNLYRSFTGEVWLKIAGDVRIYTGWLFVPAFTFEALGAKVRIAEQPIFYYDRFGGRSKMKTLSYTRDLLVYALLSRVRRSASFLKFLVVGTLGFIINTLLLLAGVQVGLTPAIAGSLGAEVAILSNFFFNNFWTFSDRKLLSFRDVASKFMQFNLLSFGSVLIQFAFLKSGELIIGLSRYKSSIFDYPFVRMFSWYFIFYLAGVAVGLVWNYAMYSRVIWKLKK